MFFYLAKVKRYLEISEVYMPKKCLPTNQNCVVYIYFQWFTCQKSANQFLANGYFGLVNKVSYLFFSQIC